jgi:hypothetical protein
LPGRRYAHRLLQKRRTPARGRYAGPHSGRDRQHGIRCLRDGQFARRYSVAEPAGHEADLSGITDRLEVKLEAINTNNFVQDRVLFTIPISRQKAGLMGTYTLASQPDAGLGDALVTYTRPSNSTSAFDNVYGTNSARLEGSFIITSYDASRRIISGSYTVKMKGPFSFVDVNSAGDPRRDGDVRLSGTFQEVPLK